MNKKRFELSGVYKITNKVNGKFYIGSGYSVFYRWYNHTNHLKQNKHTNYKLQRAFNKYGFENFSFEVIEVHAPEGLNEREQYYLDTLCKAQEYIKGKSTFFNTATYNIKPLVEGTTGLTPTIDRLIKSNRARGYGRILKVNTKGEIVNIYEMQSLAAEDNNVRRDSISLSIKKKQVLRYKDYGFIYEDTYYDGFKPSELKPHNKGVKGVITVPSNYVPVYCYDIYNRYFCTFESVTAAANYFNVDLSSISRMLEAPKKKKILQRHGVHLYQFFKTKQELTTDLLDMFSATTNNGSIEVYNLFHEYIGTFNKDKICEILGVHPYSISNSIAKKKILKGFYFIKE